jgi:hypothetical protein
VHKYDLGASGLVLVVVIFAKAVEKIVISRYSFSTSRPYFRIWMQRCDATGGITLVPKTPIQAELCLDRIGVVRMYGN